MLLVGRPRAKNKDLPLGVRVVNGRYFVRPVNESMRRVFARVFAGRKTAPLGADKDAMRKRWVALFCAVEPDAPAGTISELIDRFVTDELPRINSQTGRPLYAPSTKVEYGRIVKVLKKQFGERKYAGNAAEASTGNFVRTMHIDQYLRSHEATTPGAANHHVTCFSRIFTCAKRWGLTEYNPCHGAELNPTVPRNVVPSDEAFLKVYAEASPTLQCMMDLAQMCGPRRGAIAAMTLADIRDDGLRIISNKTKRGSVPKETIYTWSPELRATIERILAIRTKRKGSGRVERIHLFLSRKGTPYSKNALDSQWRRALDAAKIDHASFHFHDIRAKVVTESENVLEAMKRAAHSDMRTTRQVYDRKPDVVTPLNAVSRKKR